MSKLLIIFMFLIFSITSHGFKVVVDPGHGGVDRGATTEQLRESALTLELSKKLFKKLKTNPLITAVMTRDKNKSIGLKSRTQIANHLDADLFVSIHANSSTDSRAKGAEFYFQNQLTADEESMFLANKENDGVHSTKESKEHQTQTELIIEDMLRNHTIHKSSQMAIRLAKRWNGIKKRTASAIRQAPFYVISNTNMPSVLVEVGYITNAKEAKKLTQASYQSILVNDIYRAIVDFKEKVNSKEIYNF